MDDGVRRAPNKDQWIEGLEDKSSVERRDHGTEPRARAGRNVSSSVGRRRARVHPRARKTERITEPRPQALERKNSLENCIDSATHAFSAYTLARADRAPTASCRVRWAKSKRNARDPPVLSSRSRKSRQHRLTPPTSRVKLRAHAK